MNNGNHLKKGNDTKKRIINAAKQLFGTKTYDYVSTRMIAAEAKCSQSAISFYFETKENLCRAVIDDIIYYHGLYYGPILKAVRNAEEAGTLTPELAMQLLQQYIQCHISIAFNEKNRCAISFAINNQALPSELSGLITISTMEKATRPMARLLIAISDISYAEALTYSQTMCSGIYSFPFLMPDISQEIRNGENESDEPETNENEEARRLQVQQYILNFCMMQIRAIKKS